MYKFLEKYNCPKLSEEEARSLNRPITPNEIETVIKKLPTHKSPGPDGFTGEFYKAFKGELTPILHRLFQKIQEDGYSQTRFKKPTSSSSQNHKRHNKERKLEANISDEHKTIRPSTKYWQTAFSNMLKKSHTRIKWYSSQE